MAGFPDWSYLLREARWKAVCDARSVEGVVAPTKMGMFQPGERTTGSMDTYLMERFRLPRMKTQKETPSACFGTGPPSNSH